MVSVIVPIYNVEKYLQKCIDSILNQTYKDFEVILVDDGSTDSSAQICDKYLNIDNRIKVIHKENGGLGDARNAGIDIASGDYILFVDSDDYIANDLLEICINNINKYKSDMVIFDYQAVNEQDSLLNLFSFPMIKSKSFSINQEPSLMFSSPSACNKMFSKSLIDKSGVKFPPHVWYEDLRTIPKWYTFSNNITYFNEKPLYYYLVRESSIMHSNNIKRIVEERNEAICDLYNYFNAFNLTEKYYNELEWISYLHGYFYPCREIINKTNNYKKYIEMLNYNLKQNISNPNIKKNKYYKTLTLKEKLMFYILIKKIYLVISIRNTIKK